jgi:hypothetical protein
MADTYGEAVGRRLAANEGSGGWNKTPAGIVAEAVEECLDITGWLRGLDYDSLSPHQQYRVSMIEADAEDIWRELRKLERELSR